MKNLDVFKNRIITLGVCGVSTAYKSLNLAEQLRGLGARVRVVLNEESLKYVTPKSFEGLSDKVVVIESSDSPDSDRNQLETITDCDLTVIAPASFSFTGKLASGLGQDLLTDLAAKSNNPVVLAPSMNRDLYSSETVRNHLARLKDNGYHVVDPRPWEIESRSGDEPQLAIVPSNVVTKIREVLQQDQLLEERKVLVTSGPTRDMFSLPNYEGSSATGSLGFSLSQQARQMGGEVTLVSGPTEQIPPTGVGVVWTRSVEELDEVLISELPDYDLVLMAGTASDWHPELNPDILGEEKTKKLDLDIPETPDLTRKLGLLKAEDQVLIEFLPDGFNEEGFKERLEENPIDAIFYLGGNPESETEPTNSLTGSFLFKTGGKKKVHAQNGARLSREIIREVCENLIR